MSLIPCWARARVAGEAGDGLVGVLGEMAGDRAAFGTDNGGYCRGFLEGCVALGVCTCAPVTPRTTIVFGMAEAGSAGRVICFRNAWEAATKNLLLMPLRELYLFAYLSLMSRVSHLSQKPQCHYPAAVSSRTAKSLLSRLPPLIIMLLGPIHPESSKLSMHSS